MAQVWTSTALGSFAQGGVTSTSLFMHGLDNNQLVSSIGSDATATTYAVTCAAGVTTDCGLPSPYLTLTVGPKTMHYSMTQDTYTVEDDCSIALASDSAVCRVTLNGEGANRQGVSTTTLSGDEMTFRGYADVSVTDVMAGNGLAASTTSMKGLPTLGSGSGLSKTTSAPETSSNTATAASTTPAPSSGTSAVASVTSSTTSVAPKTGSHLKRNIASVFAIVAVLAVTAW